MDTELLYVNIGLSCVVLVVVMLQLWLFVGIICCGIISYCRKKQKYIKLEEPIGNYEKKQDDVTEKELNDIIDENTK